MKKKEKFGKSYKNILKIKSDFFKDNEKFIKDTIAKKNILRKQKKRINCKNCEKKISSYELTLTCHEIDYYICKTCGHFNGRFDDTDNYVRILYNLDKDQTYSKVYLNNFNERVQNIYNPKTNFLIEVLGKNHQLIDIGAGAGLFLKSLELKKINADGFESNLKLVKFGNKFLKQNKLYYSELETTYDKIKPNTYSVLSLIGVLEHLQKPNLLIQKFLKSDIEYLFISVPLFSLSSFIDSSFKDVFSRQLTADHTHLYTKESLDYLIKRNKLKILGEWWFGTDFADLFRSIVISSKIKNKTNFNKYLNKYLYNDVDNFQKILDKNKICSEVHMILKK